VCALVLVLVGDFTTNTWWRVGVCVDDDGRDVRTSLCGAALARQRSRRSASTPKTVQVVLRRMRGTHSLSSPAALCVGVVVAGDVNISDSKLLCTTANTNADTAGAAKEAQLHHALCCREQTQRHARRPTVSEPREADTIRVAMAMAAATGRVTR
jgi:hypothetical protein